MRVLIAGAGGFVGRNLVLNAPKMWEITAVGKDLSTLQKLSPQTTCIEVDFLDKEGLKQHLGSASYDYCIYLVANSDPRLAAKHPNMDLAANTQ